MRFSTNALAILASSSSSSSKGGDVIISTGAVGGVNHHHHRTLKQHQQQQKHAVTSSSREERQAERLKKRSPPPGDGDNNNDGRQSKQPPSRGVTKTVVQKLKSLRETIECDPLVDEPLVLQEERRLRGHHHNQDEEGDIPSAAAADDFVGILNGKMATGASSSLVSSKVCGVGRTCQKVNVDYSSPASSSSSSSILGGRCVDNSTTRTTTEHHRELQFDIGEPVIDTMVDSNSDDSTPTSMPTTFEPTTFLPTTSGDDFEAAEMNAGNNEFMINNEKNEDSIVTELQYACDYGELVGYDCTCDLDTENDSYTGSATCITPEICTTSPSICDVNITECYTTTYTIDLNNGIKGVWDSKTCLNFNLPYEQEVCYGSTNLEYGNAIDEQCLLSIDTQECTSCSVYKFRDENCYEFDCSNTISTQSSEDINQQSGSSTKTGNTCDFPAHSISLFMDTYGCPSCNLCGVGNELTLPDNTIALFNTTYECSYVEEVSKQGFFTVDSCSYFSNLAQIPCGCTPSSNVDVDESTDNNNDVDVDGLGGDYSTILNAACSAHSECIAADLQGDCCPTNTGDILGCCDIPTIEIDDGSNITTTVVPTTTTTAPSIDVDEIDIDGSSNFTTDAPTISGSTSSPTTVTLSPGVCNICPDGIVNPDGVISMMPGSEISCSEATTVANNGGIVGDELCEAVQKEASLPCCGIELITVVVVDEEESVTITTTPENDEDNISCSPCGPNRIMTSEQNEVSVPTQGVYTCIQLKQMGLDGTLDNNGICSLVQSSSQKACGCISDGSPTVAPSSSSNTAVSFPTAMMAGDNNAAASGAAATTTTTVAAGISMSVIIITVAVATISTIASSS